jgi:hypothetical protein
MPQQNRDGPDSKWQEIAYKIELTLSVSMPKFKNYAPLIRYLENASIRGTEVCQQISKDYNDLCKINKDIDWIIEKVSSLEADEAVFEMLAFESDFIRIVETYTRVNYLANLNEDLVYQKYRSVLQSTVGTTQD